MHYGDCETSRQVAPAVPRTAAARFRPPAPTGCCRSPTAAKRGRIPGCAASDASPRMRRPGCANVGSARLGDAWRIVIERRQGRLGPTPFSTPATQAGGFRRMPEDATPGCADGVASGAHDAAAIAARAPAQGERIVASRLSRPVQQPARLRDRAENRRHVARGDSGRASGGAVAAERQRRRATSHGREDSRSRSRRRRWSRGGYGQGNVPGTDGAGVYWSGSESARAREQIAS